MAATLQTMLIKLGFDVSGMSAGAGTARSEMASIGASASQMASLVAPGSAALNNLTVAAKAVQGSSGATTTLNNLAKAAAAVSSATGGSPAAMNSFAKGAAAIGEATGSGSALNAYARAISTVAEASGGAVGPITDFAKGAASLAQLSGSGASVSNFARQIRTMWSEAAQAAPAVETLVSTVAQVPSVAAAATSTLLTLGQAAFASTGPLIAGFNGAVGAIEAVAGSTGPLIAGVSGARGAIAATAESTGPLIAGARGAEGAITALSSSTGPLIAGLQGVDGAIAATAASTGPLVAGLQTANGAMVATRQNLAAMTAGAGSATAGATAGATQLTKAVTGAAASYNAVQGPAAATNAAVTKTAAVMDMAANRASFFNRTLSMAFAFSGGVAVTTLFGFLASALVGFNSQLEQAHISFTTLLGDEQKANAFLAEMMQFANFTPFQFAGLQTAVQQMLAVGFTANQALPVLRAIGDAVAALGGSQDVLNRVSISLGQMLTAGKVTAREMRELTMAGIPTWQMLADKMKMTIAQTRAAVTAGTIDAQTGIVDIISGMEERFGGMMAKQARTMQGAFSTIHDAALQIISGAVAPAFNALSAMMVGIADFLTNGGGRYITPMIYAIATALGVALIPRMIGLAASAETAAVSIGALTIPILPLIVAVTTLGIAWQDNWGGIQQAVQPAIKALGDATKATLGFLTSTGFLIPAIETLTTIIITRFVVGLVQGVAALVLTGISALATTGAFGGLTLAESAAMISSAGLTSSLWALVTAEAAATAGLSLLAVAGVLLITNIDRVAQGFRVALIAIFGFSEGVYKAASGIPVIGVLFGNLADNIHASSQGIMADMASAEAAINAKAGTTNVGGNVTAASFLSQYASTFDQIKALFANGTNAIVDSTDTLVQEWGTSLSKIREYALSAGGGMMADLAKGIADHRDAPLKAFEDMYKAMLNPMSSLKEIAFLYGMLTSSKLAEGLKSQDQVVVAQAIATKKLITARLDELTNGAYSAAQNTGTNIATGLASKAGTIALSSVKAVTPIIKTLDALTNGAFSAGANTAVNLAKGILSSGALAKVVTGLGSTIGRELDMLTGGHMFETAASAIAGQLQNLASSLQSSTAAATSGASAAAKNTWDDILKGAQAGSEGTKAFNDWLKTLGTNAKSTGSALATMAADAKAALTSAFDAIKASALKYFDAVHAKNLQAIADATGLADLKARLDSFQTQRSKQGLIDTYLNATTAADKMSARQDLYQFALEQQIKGKTTEYDLQVAAENARYAAQVAGYNKELAALQAFLKRHPEEWRKAQIEVLALLHKYGIDYTVAGALLGSSFAAGLKSQVKAVQLAAEALASAAAGKLGTGLKAPAPVFVPGGVPPGVKPPAKPTKPGIPYQTGAWRILEDQLAFLHKDEMVAPAATADLIRALTGPGGAYRTLVKSPSMGSGAGSSLGAGSLRASGPLTKSQSGLGRGSGSTIIYVGDQKLAEISDRQAYGQRSIYGGPLVHNGSQR